jgi:acyl carrier protein
LTSSIGFTARTGLFGHLPELDSMAVAGLLTEIEDRLGIVIDDDEVDGEMPRRAARVPRVT